MLVEKSLSKCDGCVSGEHPKSRGFSGSVYSQKPKTLKYKCRGISGSAVKPPLQHEVLYCIVYDVISHLTTGNTQAKAVHSRLSAYFINLQHKTHIVQYFSMLSASDYRFCFVDVPAGLP